MVNSLRAGTVIYIVCTTSLPGSLVGKESACNSGDPGLIPGLGRSGEGIGYTPQYSCASLVAQLVKNPPVMQETWVQSLGWKDPLEKRTATTPVFWPGEFHGLFSPWSCKELDMTEQLPLSLSDITIFWPLTLPTTSIPSSVCLSYLPLYPPPRLLRVVQESPGRYKVGAY